jgi:hypothetical protein
MEKKYDKWGCLEPNGREEPGEREDEHGEEEEEGDKVATTCLKQKYLALIKCGMTFRQQTSCLLHMSVHRNLVKRLVYTYQSFIDILNTDILSTDILSTDILSTDILSTDILLTNIYHL